MKKPAKNKATKAATAQPGWLVVKNLASADAAEMLINGPIGKSWYDPAGVASKDFRNELSKIPKGRKVNVRINSEGGSIGDALEIYNVLRDRSDDVTCYVDGYALSSASIIALGGGRLVAPKSSILMIHEPWSMTVGDQTDHLKAAEMLDKHGDTIAAIYAKKTGESEEEMRNAMRAESWFTGEEAVDFGLADTTGEDDDGDDDDVAGRFAMRTLDVAAYRNMPQHVMNALISAGAVKQQLQMQATEPPAQIPAEPISSATGVVSGEQNAGPAASPNDKQQTMTPSTTPVAAATPPATPDLAQAIEHERKARISAEVKRRANNKITNENLAFWIDSAMRNEEGTYAQLDALPLNRPGGEPLGAAPAGAPQPAPSRVVECHPKCTPRPAKRFDFQSEIANHKSPAVRLAALKKDWDAKLNYCIEQDVKANGGQINLPVNSNTYSSTLVTDFLVDVAITQLQNRWAALESFTRDFTTDRYKPLATGQVKLVTAGATTLTATKSSFITNFEQGDSTVSPISVPMQHYSQPFHVAQDELMSGLRMENISTINLAVLADTIVGKALSPIASSIFSAGTYYASKGTFGWTNEMPDLWGYLKKSPLKHAILDGPYMARLINQPGFYQPTMNGERDAGRAKVFGWDSISENTLWSTAGANVAGFVCNPQAIAVVAGLPQVPPVIPGSVLQETAITIPGPDISIAMYSWFSLSSRTLWNSYDVVFGAAAGDLTAAAVLFNGVGTRS